MMFIPKAVKSTQSISSISVAVSPQTNRFSQSNSPLSQNDQNIGLTALIFITSVIIGFAFGRLWFKRYEQQRAKQMTKVLNEFETLKHIQKVKPETEKCMSLQRQKQIETLERIWKI